MMLMRAPKADPIAQATAELREFLANSESPEFIRARDHYRALRDERSVERERYAAICTQHLAKRNAGTIGPSPEMEAAEKRLETLELQIEQARGKYILARDAWLPGVIDDAKRRLPQGDQALIEAALKVEGVVNFYATLDEFSNDHGKESHLARGLRQNAAQLRAKVSKHE